VTLPTLTSRRTAALDGSGEGVQAVAHQLVRRDVASEVPGLRALGQQVSDEVAEVLLRSGDVLASMQERRKLGAVLLVLDERVSLEHNLETVEGFDDPSFPVKRFRTAS